MNKMEESFLRLCLHPKVECDLPGRLRISFSKYHLLPKEALPYLRWVDIVVDEGICISKEDVWQNAGEKELEEIVRQRLILRLPQQKKG